MSKLPDHGKKLTRARAIRLHCLACVGNQPSEVRRCQIKDCFLYEFRMGRKLDKDETENE